MTVALVLVISGCSEPTGTEDPTPTPTPLVTATYRLARFDGRPLPVDRGPYPTRTGGMSSCHRLVPGGALGLDVERGRYVVYYSERSSCQAHLTSQPGGEGDFEPTGDELLPGRIDLDGTVHRLTASVDGDTVAVDFFQDHALVFADPDTSTFQPSGTFDLVRIEDTPIPFDGGGDPDSTGDRLYEIGTGSLRLEHVAGLEPWTGRYTLEFELLSARTGNLSTFADESGTYEQIGRVLRFRGELGSNTVHLFRGMVRDDRIDLLLGGLPALVFE